MQDKALENPAWRTVSSCILLGTITSSLTEVISMKKFDE